MASQSHRRQVFLFLAAVLLPCVALLALGLLLVVQERELGATRLNEERRRVTRQLRQDLASQLERIALRQATALADRPELLQAWTYDDSLVALVARFAEGRLSLPWEQDQLSSDSRALLGQGEFGERARQGERAEFASEDYARAVNSYGQALEVARQPLQEAHARHLLARALNKAGRQEDAATEYLRLVAAPPTLVDENGIPISLYAARQLLEAGRGDTSVSQAVRRCLSAESWLAPPALYLLRDLVDRLSSSVSETQLLEDVQNLVEAVSGELARTQQALALKADFAGLGLRPPDTTLAHRENGWIAYGTPTWLVGAAPVGYREDGVLVAVRSEPVLASLGAGTYGSGDIAGAASLTTAAAPDVEPLGSDFPDVFVRFHPTTVGSTSMAGSIRWWFYSIGLVLVVGVTLFGAYLLWRDVRREMQLAETRSRFVSAVSHELKTPLTAIRMFAETLYDDAPADSGTHREYLETIVNESERLTRLLNNVLDFSKIERGQKAYRRESHSLEEIVRSTARAMQYPLEQKRFALRLQIEDDIPRAQVDRDAIEQALLNLLGNAMKYSGKSRDIELRLRSEDGEAVIEVSDQGVGIEPAELSRIFERFYRVPGPENERISGTGLGLTLVQHIAEAHEGRVEVKSEPGKGSTFSLFLPLDGVAT
jgi:signal transduction histidine kinase